MTDKNADEADQPARLRPDKREPLWTRFNDYLFFEKQMRLWQFGALAGVALFVLYLNYRAWTSDLYIVNSVAAKVVAFAAAITTCWLLLIVFDSANSKKLSQFSSFLVGVSTPLMGLFVLTLGLGVGLCLDPERYEAGLQIAAWSALGVLILLFMRGINKLGTESHVRETLLDHEKRLAKLEEQA